MTAPVPGDDGPIPASHRIAVAGAGAAGTLVALHLARTAAADTPLTIVLIDPGGALGASAAFATDDERHLLNVPASGMSALPDEPGHFVAWRNDVAGTPTDPYEFVPRRDFARYLRHTLDAAVAAAPGVRLVVRRTRAVGADHTVGGVRVRCDDGDDVVARALVVATGLGAPSTDWAPPALVDSLRFVADPWVPGALDGLVAPDGVPPGGAGSDGDGTAADEVLVVGSGLTMIDVVLSCVDAVDGRRVHVVSRSGALPHRHAPAPVVSDPADVADWGSGLDEVRDRVNDRVRVALDTGGDWRPAIDGLRTVTATLWQRFSEADRATFLTRDAGAWNRARHRTPITTADRIAALERAGRFTLTAATVRDADARAGGGLRVHLDDGSHRDVAWVVNAAGPRTDVATLGNPLLDDLLARGFATPATAGMGFRTDDGRLVAEDFSAAVPVFTLGALRRGELWESTAVPEIRTQAAALARTLVELVTVR